MRNNITELRFQLAIPRLIPRFVNQSECKILFNYAILPKTNTHPIRRLFLNIIYPSFKGRSTSTSLLYCKSITTTKNPTSFQYVRRRFDGADTNKQNKKRNLFTGLKKKTSPSHAKSSFFSITERHKKPVRDPDSRQQT